MTVKQFFKKIIKAILPYGFLVLYRNIKKKHTSYKFGGGIIPEKSQNNVYEKMLFLKHQFAYNLAAKYLRPEIKVLDYGCGDGYGSNFLATKSPESFITGVDIDVDVIKDAQKKYKKENLKFDLINNIHQNFELILSFQVIEHVPNVKDYLEKLKYLSCQNGIIIISTPDRKYRLNDGQKPWNKYHLREYDRLGFISEISKVFMNPNIYQLTGDLGLLRIEYERCAKSRQDGRIYGGIQATPIQLSKNYTLDDLHLISDEINDSLDLFAIIGAELIN
jgi:2-polyprenyl-3-methyl-5-hydroxy-6-metoxy-1,4-benzoquinol methylase